MGVSQLVRRILTRLEEAERRESNPHFQDDYRIAWFTVLKACRRETAPHVLATHKVLGLHPSKVWPAIVARRKAQLGRLYSSWYGADDLPLPAEDLALTLALPPKKPCESARLSEPEKRRRVGERPPGDADQFLENRAPVVLARRREKVPSSEKANGADPVSRAAVGAFSAKPAMASAQPAYPNSQRESNGNLSPNAFAELVRYSSLPLGVQSLIQACLRIANRGAPQFWPSVDALAAEMGKHRRTVQYHRRRAVVALGIAHRRGQNTWAPCPKCHAPRDTKTCSSCGYVGNRKNDNEFRPTATFEFDIEKIASFERRPYRNYRDYVSAKRKRAVPAPQPSPPVQQSAVEPQHRTPLRPAPVPVTQGISRKKHREMTLRQRLGIRMAQLMKGGLSQDLALQECGPEFGLTSAEVADHLKLMGWKYAVESASPPPNPEEEERIRRLMQERFKRERESNRAEWERKQHKSPDTS